MLYLLLLLLNRLERVLLLKLVHARAGGLLDHGEDLRGLHIEHLRDAALHDEEVRVVHVELHRVEQVLHAVHLRVVPVDEVLVAPADHHLRRE